LNSSPTDELGTLVTQETQAPYRYLPTLPEGKGNQAAKAFHKHNQSSQQQYVLTQLEHKTSKSSLQNPKRVQPPKNANEHNLH